ncbi:MAG: calcium-binding protein [Solirubrobacterales bacterium]
MRGPALLATGLLAACAGLVSLAAPDRSPAASGCGFTALAGFGGLSVEGDNSPENGCAERISVRCTGGFVEVDHSQPPASPPTVDFPDDLGFSGYQPYPCANLGHIEVLGSFGNDIIDLSPVDHPAGFGTLGTLVTTLDGGDGSDSITGSSFRDRISQGNDGGGGPIAAGAGNDRLVGDSGKDSLKGGPGRDTLLGLEGSDSLTGGGGEDAASGGDGADRIDGQVGADRLSGDSGRDVVRGGPGNDALFGGPGRDRLVGGPGRDRVRQ